MNWFTVQIYILLYRWVYQRTVIKCYFTAGAREILEAAKSVLKTHIH